MEKYAGTMATPVEVVQQRLATVGFSEARTHIVPGFIEESIKSANLPQKICFAYVDFDFYEPILTVLRWLHPRLAAGGTVIVDDYGFFSAGAKTAVDEFLADVAGEFEVTLPRKFAAESTPFCILRRTAKV
jgi:cephalosporin hydroxylase